MRAIWPRAQRDATTNGEPVGWVELLRNPSHAEDDVAQDGFRKSSTHPTGYRRLPMEEKPSCAFQDVRRHYGPASRGAGSSRERRPPRSPPWPRPSRPTPRRGAFAVRSISLTPCHPTSRPSSACRESSWRRSSTSRRTASICTGGASSSTPARISMRRSISRKTAPPPTRSLPANSWCRSR